MVNNHVPEILSGVDKILSSASPLSLITGGHGAAVAVVRLMADTFAAIQPREILDAFLPIQEQKPKDRSIALWKSVLKREGGSSTIGEETIKVMADGCLCLAQIWDSAWAEGKGKQKITKLGAVSQGALETLYQDPDFLPSPTLDTISSVLASGGGAGTRSKTKKIKPRAARPSRRRNKR